jgi:hypothetical protein
MTDTRKAPMTLADEIRTLAYSYTRRKELLALAAKVEEFERDAARWRWLRDAPAWTCEINKFSNPQARQYLWGAQFSSPYHNENATLDAAIDAALSQQGSEG